MRIRRQIPRPDISPDRLRPDLCRTAQFAPVALFPVVKQRDFPRGLRGETTEEVAPELLFQVEVDLPPVVAQRFGSARFRKSVETWV